MASVPVSVKRQRKVVESIEDVISREGRTPDRLMRLKGAKENLAELEAEMALERRREEEVKKTEFETVKTERKKSGGGSGGRKTVKRTFTTPKDEVVTSVKQESSIPTRRKARVETTQDVNMTVAPTQDIPRSNRFTPASVQDIQISRKQSLARTQDLQPKIEVAPKKISAARTISEIRKEEGLTAAINERIRRLLVESEAKEKKDTISSNLFNIRAGIESSALGLGAGVAGLAMIGKSRVKNPSLLISDVKNVPSAIKNIPSAISRSGASIGKSLKSRPRTTTAEIATEILAPSFLRRSGRRISAETAKFSKDFLPTQKVQSRGFRATKRGVVQRAGIDEDVLRGITDRETGKVSDVVLRGGASTTAEPLSVQVTRAGKTVTGVSAQEGLVPKTLTRSGQTNIDLRPVKGDLERTFFADPQSRLRTTRLGTNNQKSFAEKSVEAVTEPVKINFAGSRPQAFVFGSAKVERFPKDLRGVIKKDPSLKSLTPSQRNRLESFQLQPRNTFTAPGFLSRESEIVTTASRLVVDRSGTAVIGGRRVPFFSAKTSNKPLKTGLDVSDDVKSKRRSITRRVSRDRRTGFNVDALSLTKGFSSQSVSSAANNFRDQKISNFSGDSDVTSNFLGGSKSSPFTSSNLSGTSTNINKISPISSNDSISFSPTPSKTNIKPPSSPISPDKNIFGGGGSFTQPPRKKGKSPFRLPELKSEKKGKKKSKVSSYNAFVKRKGRYEKINEKGLSKKQALKAMFEEVDNTPSATGKIRKGKKKINKPDFVSISPSRRDKFRRKKNKKNVYVEKDRFRIDSVGELFGITRKGLNTSKKDNSNMKDNFKGDIFEF
jgi:hypothetical protein